MQGYEIRLYDLDDEEVARDLRMPTVPPIGSQLSLPDGHTWEVTSPAQFDLHHPASQAAAERDPIVIELQVRPAADGLHPRRARSLEPLEKL